MTAPPNLSPAALAAANATPVNAPNLTIGDFATSSGSPGSIVNDVPQVQSTRRFPSDTPLYYTSLAIQKYSRDSWASVGMLDPESTLVLPIPEQVVDTQHVTYDQVPIGGLGSLAMSATGNAKNAVDSTLSQLPQDLLNTLTQAGVNLSQLTLGNLASGVPNGILVSQGISINDFLTVMLKGPAYKQFALSWKLSPRTWAESRDIKAIEIMLKNAQAVGRWGSASVFWTWPRVFRVSFMHYAIGDKMGDRLYRFKPAVLTDAIFNYAPGGVPSFYGQSQYPEGVQVQLQFMELELWVNSSRDAQDAYGTVDQVLDQQGGRGPSLPDQPSANAVLGAGNNGPPLSNSVFGN